MSDLLRRQQALAATRAAFVGKPIDWVEADCGRMLALHLRMMGHEPPTMPKYRTARGAALSLRKLGGFAAVLDGMGLERVTPLAMLPGDVGVLPGEGGMDAAVIWVGRKCFGWHEDSDELANMTPDLTKLLAWRA